MILNDSAILQEIEAGNILITPFERECLGSNSYDVHLSRHLLVYSTGTLDAKADNSTTELEIGPEGFELIPGELYLGSTLEYTETLKHVPFIEGKSSTGRLGISIHATAGKGDVGFKGNWTLEIEVTKRVRVYAGMPIGQLIFFLTQGECMNPYDRKSSAKYSGQPAVPVASKMHKNDWSKFADIALKK